MIRLALVLLLVLAPAAAAQEAPDERAAARRWPTPPRASPTPCRPRTPSWRSRPPFRCESVEQRIPRNRRRAAIAILTRNTNRVIGEILREDLGRLRTDLANVQTRDPALLSGRAAWRQIARAFMALPATGDSCAELRAWLRAGAPRSEGREARAEVEVIERLARRFERKVEAAADRMIELGVPEEQADTFRDD